MYLDNVAPQTVSFTGTATIPKTAYGNLIVGQWTSNTNYDTFIGVIDEVHLIWKDLSTIEISDLFNGIEKSHMSKTYHDGLGRTTRTVAMDMLGKKIQTVATLGWNDKPIYAYLPSGQYSTFTYDFLGRTLTAQSPGDSTISGSSRTIISQRAGMVESIDALGRKAYSRTDLLGRTVETAVWNPQTGAYGNLTNASYNALSEIVSSKDAKGQTTTKYYNSLGKPKMSIFPDVTNSTVYYDDNLRPFENVDVMGRVSISGYDKLGRLISVTVKPSLLSSTTYMVSYGYDSVHDDLVTIDNGTAKVTRAYDGLHRLKTEELDVPSGGTVIGTLAYQYDSAGKLSDIQYPGGLNTLHASYVYDSLGRPIEVDLGTSAPYPKYASLSYDSFGRLWNIHYWKGSNDTSIQEAYAYDLRDRVTQIKVYNGGACTTANNCWMQQNYSYDKASEITGVVDDMFTGTGGASSPKSVNFAYDGNGRLAQAVGPYGSNDATEYNCYDYDAVGNIAHWRQGSSSCPTSGAGYYTYNPTGWNELASITNLLSLSFTYNGAGSQATKSENSATTTYTHDFLQQLVKIVSSSNTYSYSYDGLGRRITNVTNSGPTSYFMYSKGEMLYSKVASIETAFIYVGGKMLMSSAGLTGDTWYYHQDLSGNIRLINYYSSSNAVTTYAKYRYRPFGDLITLSGGGQKFQFANQELDSAARLYHMGARYHDPLVGRFIERDPIGPGYDYAYNNPISFSDPSGMSPLGDVSGLLRGAKNWLEDQWGHNPTFRAAVGLVITVLMAVLIPVGGELIDMLLLGALVGTIFWANTMVASHGTASAADQIAAFSDGFAIGTILYNVAVGFRLIGRAGELAAGKAILSATEKTGLSGAAREAGRAGIPSRFAAAADGGSVEWDFVSVLRPPTSSEARLFGSFGEAERGIAATRGLSQEGKVFYSLEGQPTISETITRTGIRNLERQLDDLDSQILRAIRQGDPDTVLSLANEQFEISRLVANQRLALEGGEPVGWQVLIRGIFG